MRHVVLSLSYFAAFLAAPGTIAGPGDAFKSDEIETVFQFSLAPAGITAAPDGAWLLSVNQAEKPRTRVVKVSRSGKVEPFPNEKMSDAAPDSPLPLDAVEGLQLAADDLVWMLDNGRRGEVTPKIIAWNLDKNRLQHVHYIGQPAVVPGSFLADLAVDPAYPFVYVTDPANGPDAALIVLDRTTGLARRVLQGHPSVVPDASISIQADPVSGGGARRLDGVQTFPHAGADALALDRKGEWLYYAPLRSGKLYRVRTEFLRSADTDALKLAQSVETYADKPPTTSISIDNKGNVYIGDIRGRAIGVIEADKKEYRVLTSDPRLVAPDGLCFGADGKLYFFSRSQFGSQAARMPASSPATLSTTPSSGPQHSLYRMKPLAPGRVGD